jgi:hypothetical protein
MLKNFRAIRKNKLRNIIPSISLSGYGVEELCVLISKLGPSQSTPLFPVLVLRIFLNVASGVDRGLKSSKLSSSRRSLLLFSVQIESLDIDLLQDFKSCLSLLNFAFKLGALFAL